MATTTPASTPETHAGSLRIAAPAAVTLASLVSGFGGLVLASGGHIEGAVGMVYLAALFDAMDGRLARALGGGSRFGAELDSLADVVCFGALPALILYQWLLHAAGIVGFAGAASLAAAAAVRLARFNVAAADADRPRWTAGYFVGVPAPAGALLALSPVYLAEAGWLDAQNPYLMALWPLVVAAMMVSRWPTFSGKIIRLKVSRAMLVPPLIVALAAALGMAVSPWATLSLVMAGYLATLPVSRWRFRVLARRNGLRRRAGA